MSFKPLSWTVIWSPDAFNFSMSSLVSYGEKVFYHTAQPHSLFGSNLLPAELMMFQNLTQYKF